MNTRITNVMEKMKYAFLIMPLPTQPKPTFWEIVLSIHFTWYLIAALLFIGGIGVIEMHRKNIPKKKIYKWVVLFFIAIIIIWIVDKIFFPVIY